MDLDINEIAWEQATRELNLRVNPQKAIAVVPLIDIALEGFEIGEGTPLPISSWAAVQMDGSFRPCVGVCWPGLRKEILIHLVGTPYASVLRFCKLVDS